MFRSSAKVVTAGLFAFALQASASADDECRKCGAEADIDSLKAELVPAGDDWVVNVRYEVKIEDARRGERFLLGLQLEDRGVPLADENGQAQTLLIPLDQPTKWDDDELEFEAWVELSRFPNGALYTGDLSVNAFVEHEGHPCRLDQERTGVRHPAVVVEVAEPVVEVVRPAPVIVRREYRPAVIVTRPAPVIIRSGPRVIVREHRGIGVHYADGRRVVRVRGGW